MPKKVNFFHFEWAEPTRALVPARPLVQGPFLCHRVGHHDARTGSWPARGDHVITSFA